MLSKRYEVRRFTSVPNIRVAFFGQSTANKDLAETYCGWLNAGERPSIYWTDPGVRVDPSLYPSWGIVEITEPRNEEWGEYNL